MATFLFSNSVFGPVFSRRLGQSLGINLLANNSKVCNYNCIYCECGITDENVKLNEASYQIRKELYCALESRLDEMYKLREPLDTITFAGNGEPTMHPEFPAILDDVIELRDKYFPNVKIAVLSNATMINNLVIFDALNKVDFNILKLDSAIYTSLGKINKPLVKFDIQEMTDIFKKFNSKVIIQTLFLKANVRGQITDNTTEEEVSAWLKVIEDVKPQLVMIYTFSRSTAFSGLERISIEKLNEIAERVKKIGIETQVSG